MTDLADRIEALSGPCRETDALIWAARHPDGIELVAKYGSAKKAVGIKYGCSGFDGKEPIWSLGSYRGPAYTASIDCAMSLVPEGWKLRQMNFSGPCADDRKWHLNLHGGKVGEDCFVGRGANPALALAAAAIRAKGEMI